MRKIFFFLLFLTEMLCADLYDPWFVGPFLIPSSVNMPFGHPSVEASVTAFNFYGIYDAEWKMKRTERVVSINPFLYVQLPFSEKLGMDFYVSSLTNFQGGKNVTYLQDSTVYLGYQLSVDDQKSWVPNCRIQIQEVFPTGNYQDFKPEKAAISSTGLGSFQTGPTIVLQKVFNARGHPLSLEWSAGYFFPASVQVKGFNTYGGGYGTKGKVRPGQSFLGYFSGEYAFNQRWAFAFDTQFLVRQKCSFSGEKGTVTASTGVAAGSGVTGAATVGLPSLFQLSFAPELEYHFSAKAGLLGGLWFSLAGRNAQAFSSAFIAYSYIF